MKKAVTILLTLCMILSLLAGCGTKESAAPTSVPAEPQESVPQAREFTDSTGRTVAIPNEITKIAISGPLSQVYILPLAGDMLVGVSNAYAEDAAQYLPDYIFEKTEIGQLYGSMHT